MPRRPRFTAWVSKTTLLSQELDPFDPELEHLSKLVRELPGRPHPALGTRLVGQGLRTIRVGRRHFTRRDVLREFLNRRRPEPADIDDPTTEPSDADLEAIEAECEAAGL